MSIKPYLTDVKAMHTKFGINYEGAPRNLSLEEETFRAGALLEEVNEYVESFFLADQLDALVDLMVFTIGTVERMGITAEIFDEAWRRVMAANMQKELAGDASRSKRDFAIDLVKPEGWTAPNHDDLFEERTTGA